MFPLVMFEIVLIINDFLQTLSNTISILSYVHYSTVFLNNMLSLRKTQTHQPLQKIYRHLVYGKDSQIHANMSHIRTITTKRKPLASISVLNLYRNNIRYFINDNFLLVYLLIY